MIKASLGLVGLLSMSVPALAVAQEAHSPDHDHAHEQGGAPDAFIETRLTELSGYAASVLGYGQISGIAIEDMNGDQRLEALVVSGEDCSTQFGCAWTALTEGPEGWRPIGKGYAQEVSFLRSGGAENFVIDTDGVHWVYRGGKEISLSTGELAKKRPLRPTEADYAFLAEAKPQFEDRAAMDLVRYEIDIDLDGTPETVLVVRGAAYGMGTSGRPYLILDRHRNILVDSATPDLPIIFPAENAGLIVNPVPTGLQILELR